MTMFAKRVKTIRDMNAEADVLDKRVRREISKLNDNIQAEIKKKLKKILPGLQAKIRKVRVEDFLRNEKHGTPLLVLVESLNGKKVHTERVWVDDRPVEDAWYETDNRITVDNFEEVCRTLSEECGVNLQINKVTGRIE
jgi:hypothetical protein